MGRFKGLCFATGCLLLVVLLSSQGCNGKVPALPRVLAPAPAPLAPNVISDFENGSPNISPLLAGTNNGTWRLATFGGPGYAPNTVPTVFVVPNTVPDATNSSNFALHFAADLRAAGTGCGYEADQLVCPLYNQTAGTYFDASAYTGIQFMINVQPTDTNTSPVFQVVIDQTEPPAAHSGTSGGICTGVGCSGGCYDHYQAAMPKGTDPTAGTWQTITLTWNQFSWPSFGTAPSPNNLAAHLDKIIFLQWTYSDNTAGSPGSPVVTRTDFWIDNVEFLP